MLSLLLACAGCTYERVVYDGWAEYKELADAPVNHDEHVRPALSAATQGWAILLESFEGSRAQRRATKLVERLQRMPGWPDVWLGESEGKVHVYCGRFASGQDPQAQAELERVRRTVIDGVATYEQAALVPLDPVARAVAAATDSMDAGALDLSQYAGLGLYTLQIGFYDADFGPDYRKAAVKAVEALRGEGVEAYVYHGPNRSMITVGIFSDADFVPDGQMRAYGPRIREVQEKFPNNLSNGLTLLEKVGGEVTGNQPSFLVRVP